MTSSRFFRSSLPLADLMVALGALFVPGFFVLACAQEPTSQPAGYSATGYLNFEIPVKLPETLVQNNFDQFMATQAFVIQSYLTLGEVIVDPDVLQTRWYNTAKKRKESLDVQLRKILTVQRVPNTTIMEVTVTLPDRNDAKLLANKVIEKYLQRSTQLTSAAYLEKIEALTQEYARVERQTREHRDALEKAGEELAKCDESSAGQALRFWQEEYLKQQRLVLELEIGAASPTTTQPDGNARSHPERLVAAQRLLIQLQENYEKAVTARRESQIKKLKYEELNEAYRQAREIANETSEELIKLQIDRRDPGLRRGRLIIPAE